MKPFKFKTKATVLHGVKEEAPKRKVNWDRIIYLLLFVIILLSILYYAISKSFYVNVYGQVHTEQFSVQFPEDVSILKYFVNENDSVEKGDTLFYYRMNLLEDNNSGNAAAAVVVSASDWYLKERIRTQKEINLAFIDIDDAKNNINRIKKELEVTKKEVYLDVYPQVELKKDLLELDKYYVDIDKLEQEIAYLKKYLSLLNYYEQLDKNRKPVINTSDGDVVLVNYYKSPVSGLVSKIFKDAEEVTYKKDLVMYLNDTSKIFILAFLDQKDLKHFDLDEKLTFRFPDGLMGSGIISTFYINTEEIPPEFMEVKSRKKRRVVIKLIPETKEDANEWKKYHLMEVQIKKTKFN
jgi:hypothetical protein